MVGASGSQNEDMPGREAVDQVTRNEQLYDAAGEADVETVKKLLTDTSLTDINSTAHSGMTALYWTVLKNEGGCEEVVEVLLKHGADCTIRDPDQETPLWRAVAEGNAKNVSLLLEKDFNVDAVNNFGTPMLYQAVMSSDTMILDLLLAKKPKLEAKDADGETPLWRAVEKGNEEMVRCLLNAGADVNTKDSRSRSILHRIVNSDRMDIMVILVALAKMKLDIDPRDDYGATPLWRAVSDGKASFQDHLLAHGADDKVKDKRGVSILHLAAENGMQELVKGLIERKAEINAYDDEGRSPLSRAVASGSKDCVESLLKAGAEIQHEDSAGMTIFHEAVKSDNMEIFRLLTDARMAATGLSQSVIVGPIGTVAFKTMVNSKAKNDETPLLRAVINQNREIVEFLLCNGAKLNGFDSYGDSELSYAAYLENLEIIRLLLEYNPNIESKSPIGMTPFLWAAYRGNVEIGRLLSEKGASISTVTTEKETALSYATYFNHISFMELLFKLSTDADNLKQQIPSPSDATGKKGNLSLHSKLSIELKISSGRTPLLIAAANGSKEAVALLLKNRANYEAKDDQGWTALHLATQSGSLDTVNTLLSTASSVIVNAKNSDGDTALHIAAKAKLDRIVQALLEYRPPKAPSKDQTSDNNPIEEDRKAKVTTSSRGKNNTRELEVSLKEKNNNGETAFSLAVKQEAGAIVQILIKHEADIEYIKELDETDNVQRVPWPVVVESKGVISDAGELLEKMESNWDKDESEILYWAARNGLEELVQRVLSRNGSLKGKALYWAAFGGKKSVVDSLLVIKKDEKDGKDKFQKLFEDEDAGAEALEAAATFGYDEIVNQLSDGFRRFNQEMITEDHVGPKAVQAAARYDHQNVVQQLIRTLMDCKPDKFRLGDPHDDTATWTPLHWAIHYNSKKSDVIVRNILMSGADGAIVLEVARKLKELHPAILPMLKTPLRVTRKPFQLSEPDEQPKLVRDACKPFDINIIDIYSWEGRSCTVERIGDVHEIIYEQGHGPSQAMESAREAWQLDSIGLQDQYRWIHLPANNWTWVEDLMKRILSESKRNEDSNTRNEAFTRLKNFVDRNSREHIGTTQSRCVYPFIAFESDDIFSGKGLNMTQVLRRLQSRARTEQAARKRMTEPPTHQSATMIQVDQQDFPKREGALPTARVQAERNFGTESVSRDPKEAKPATIQTSRELKPNHSLQGSQMALCMPFLTFQKVKSHRALRQAIRVVDEIVSVNEAELIHLQDNPSESSLETKRKLRTLRITARKQILIKERDIGLQFLNPDSDGIKNVELIKNNCLTTVSNICINETALETNSLYDVLTTLRNTKLFCTPETIEWMERFRDAIELYNQISSIKKPEEPEEPSPEPFKHELLLLQYYTKPEDPKGLHISRTLDQYYYSALSDTLYRDTDQVIRRYQAKRRKEDDKRRDEDEKIRKIVESAQTHSRPKYNKKKKKKGNSKQKMKDPRYQDDPEAKIGMVDQLWLWVIDEKTVITCFPDSSGQENDNSQPAGPELENKRSKGGKLIDKIRTHIHDEARPQISSVYHLATIITSFCVAEVEDCRADIEDRESWLNMFASSIGTVADKEVKCFEAFKRDIRKGEDSDDERNEEATGEHHVLDEIELLEEIKDIRDELNMLKSIFEDQKDLLQKLFSLIAGSHSAEKLSPDKDPVLNYYQERSKIDSRIEKAYKMDKDAKTVYDSLNHLLELKQKNANIFEAVEARRQSAETARQGRTIMVFTIVTIIFLPLSFLTSMYALNIESFPHKGDSVAYRSSWIFSRIFGTSVAIAVPLVTIAFYVTNILEWFKQTVKRYQKRKIKKEREKEEKENANRASFRLSTGNLGQVSKTTVGNAGSRSTFKSQLLSIIPWEKTRRGEIRSTNLLTPSDIEAGKQPLVKENPDKP